MVQAGCRGRLPNLNTCQSHHPGQCDECQCVPQHEEIQEQTRAARADIATTLSDMVRTWKGRFSFIRQRTRAREAVNMLLHCQRLLLYACSTPVITMAPSARHRSAARVMTATSHVFGPRPTTLPTPRASQWQSYPNTNPNPLQSLTLNLTLTLIIACVW